MKASLTDKQKMKMQEFQEKRHERMQNLSEEQKAKMKEAVEKSKDVKRTNKHNN